MHLSSLAGPGGIGTMGKEARNFVDFLQAAGQSYWQLLPICPTSYGDSPYQSFSTFAGNPYFIDLELLEEEGLLSSHTGAKSFVVLDEATLARLRSELLKNDARTLIDAMKQMGLSKEEALALIENHWN